jgi:prepilin-type N-terminal cleavage/methylation domain-containing protein
MCGEKKFTLVELLVVIAIIGILSSMLLPSLQSARGKAFTAVCLNNQKQLAVTYTMYADENKGSTLPRIFETNKFWMGLLYPYHESEEIIQCASVQHPVKSGWYWGTHKTGWGGDGGWMKYNGINARGAYAINGHTYSSNGNANATFYSLAQVKSTSNTPIFTDSNWVDTWPSTGTANPTSVDGSVHDNSLARIYLDRHHAKKVNSVQFDCSAKTVSIGNLLYFDWSKNQTSYRAIPLL